MDRHSLSHDAAADDLPAYVLGALDAEDCQAMAAHLAACPLCQQERQRLEATLGALATLAPPVSPPPDLRNRLLAQVTAKADGFGTMPPESWVTVAPPLARTRPSRWTRFALVAAAALIVGLGVWLAVLARDLAGVRADLAELRAQHALTQAALMGDARAIPLVAEGDIHAYGTLYVDAAARDALLVVQELPPTPPGKVYQVWLRQGEARTSAGVFTVDAAGRAVVRLHPPLPITAYQAMGITEEPGPSGSPGPTGKRIASCQLA